MSGRRYGLRYLTLFYKDPDEKVTLIDDDENNPVMEVRRFLYNGQNQRNMI